VIIDTQSEDIEHVVMSDDGTGTGLNIPSMIISKEDGKILKDFLKNQPDELTSQAAVQAEFVVDNPENTVEMEFWYTSGKDTALDFLKAFSSNISPIIYELDFSPHIVTWSCTYCDSDYKKKNCFGDGKYCGLRTDKASIKSKDLVLEDLRQVCIH
jgi:hypothetical protein